LVRCISPSRFLNNRSGEKIYIACDRDGNPLVESLAIERTQSQLYSLYDYHVLRQNCHKFVGEMIAGTTQDITSFSDLNVFLSGHFNTPIDWRLTQVKLP
jgi:Cft2 family RNA processing exonuclease